jgi:hypothetical protein
VVHSWSGADGRLSTHLLHRRGSAVSECSDTACAPDGDALVLVTRVLGAAEGLVWRFSAQASCFRGCWIAVGRPLARSLVVTCGNSTLPAFDDAGCDPLLWVPRPRVGVRATARAAAG